MQTLYQQKELKILFGSGGLRSCFISEHDNQIIGGLIYILNVIDKHGNVYQLRTRRDEYDIKKFKSLKAAFDTAKEIGFKKISIDIN
jgi:hypothetical protein